jgi:hypothetical protein
LEAVWKLEAAALLVGYRSASALLFVRQRDRSVSACRLRKFEVQ